MPRRRQRQQPRWRRGQAVTVRPVQLTGRQARQFAREYARVTRADPATANDRLAATGAWRFRRHLVPFAWLAVTLAAAVILRVTPRPVPYAVAAAVTLGALLVWATRHLSRFARRSAELAAAVTLAWLPILAAAGFARPVPALLAVTWAPFTLAWVKHYGWRPAVAQAKGADPVDTSDEAIWARLAAERKWNAHLGPAEMLPGGARRYPIQADGIKTVVSNILAASENIAGAWHKPMTEAYAERDPHGITSRGHLTILGGHTLMEVREWDGTGIDPATGTAVIGRYADGSPVHVKFYTPRYGTRHALISGTTGSGKTELLNLLVFIALASGRFVPVILDPQEGQSLPFWRDQGCLYAAGVDECHRMLRGVHAGMLDRSRYLATFRWDDDGLARCGMPFFDHDLTGLPMPLIIFDEAHMALKGDTRPSRLMIEQTTEVGRLGRKTGTSLWLATHIPGLSELGGEHALRDMLRGGNVVSMRTANRVGGGMVGLEKDPSEIPMFFADGRETYGLGYAAGPDNRPDAPMRSDLVPKSAYRKIPAVTVLDDRFLEAMDRAMRGLKPPSAPAADPEPADDSDGRRCVDAVWQVLADSGQPMERGEIIKWVSELATTGWGREKAFAIRSVTNALNTLLEGDGGRVITKVREGVYQVTVTQLPRDEEGHGTA